MSQQLYTTAELVAMTPEELKVAQANGFVKPTVVSYGSASVGATTVPLPDGPVFTSPTAPPQDPYAVTAWGSNEYDFTVPSGQTCRMRKLRPEDAIGTGILDKITRLPAFADELIQKAEGNPPTPPMPEQEQMDALVEVLNDLLPIVVVRPRVYRTEEEQDAPGAAPGVLVRDIELIDRIAIMERATGGVAKMDNFRSQS